MPANKKLLILPGDGIGPEVMHEVRRVIDWMDRRRAVTFDLDRGSGRRRLHRCARRRRSPTPTMARAQGGGRGAVRRGRRSEMGHAGFDMRPEIAILRLRGELGLFANLRPAIVSTRWSRPAR